MTRKKKEVQIEDPIKIVQGEVIPRNKELATTTPALARVLRKFLEDLDDRRNAAGISIPNIASTRKKEINRVIKKLNSYPTEFINGNEHLVAHDAHTANEILKTIREVESFENSRITEAVINSLFIGLFSAYDSFIGNLLKALYSENDKLFNGIKREISLSELLKFENLDLVKNDLLEKDIESFRRESYINQYEQLEKKFGIETLRNFSEWPDFIEMSQRRNLFTHCDGVVSQQYLTICTQEKFNFENTIRLGDRLEITPKYFGKTVFVLGKVAFMLTHTLWRKTIPNKVKEADEAMNNSIYFMLIRKRWKSAAEYGLFGLSGQQTKSIDDITKKIRIINTAIGLKMLGREDESYALLDNWDWSASLREFRLAVSVLKEDYKEAGRIMKEIGKTGEIIEQLSYHDWPLFEKFRDTQEFLEAYQIVYNVSFLSKVSQEAKLQQERLSDESIEGKFKTKN